MTRSLRPPEQPEEPTGPVEVPPPGSSDEELLKALVLALIAGASVEIITKILGRFAGLTESTVTVIVQWLGWLSVFTSTADELALLPRDSSPATIVLHQQAVTNAFRRAAYLVNAARRMAPAVQSKDDAQLHIAQQREEQYRKAHESMERRRNEAARQVAETVAGMAPDANGEILLGWLSRNTKRTCATCRAAHRRNFNALRRPRIGYPGEVHDSCECKARAPWDTRKRVESSAVPDHYGS